MGQGCSVLDCFFSLLLTCLFVCLSTPPPFIVSFILILSESPVVRSALNSQLSDRCHPAPAARPGLGFGLCACFVLLCYFSVLQEGDVAIILILLGCWIISPHPQPPNSPKQLKAHKLSIASRGRSSLCENPQVASPAGIPLTFQDLIFKSYTDRKVGGFLTGGLGALSLNVNSRGQDSHLVLGSGNALGFSSGGGRPLSLCPSPAGWWLAEWIASFWVFSPRILWSWK